MNSSDAQPLACHAEVGTTDLGIEQGKSGSSDIGEDLLGGGEIGPAIRVIEMGPDAAYEEGVGRLPP